MQCSTCAQHASRRTRDSQLYGPAKRLPPCCSVAPGLTCTPGRPPPRSDTACAIRFAVTMSAPSSSTLKLTSHGTAPTVDTPTYGEAWWGPKSGGQWDRLHGTPFRYCPAELRVWKYPAPDSEVMAKLKHVQGKCCRICYKVVVWQSCF
jgi:hypothetical protein